MQFCLRKRLEGHFQEKCPFYGWKEIEVPNFLYGINGGIVCAEKISTFLSIHHIRTVHMRTAHFQCDNMFGVKQQWQTNEWMDGTINSGCKQAHLIWFQFNSNMEKHCYKWNFDWNNANEFFIFFIFSRVFLILCMKIDEILQYWVNWTANVSLMQMFFPYSLALSEFEFQNVKSQKVFFHRNQAKLESGTNISKKFWVWINFTGTECTFWHYIWYQV